MNLTLYHRAKSLILWGGEILATDRVCDNSFSRSMAKRLFQPRPRHDCGILVFDTICTLLSHSHKETS